MKRLVTTLLFAFFVTTILNSQTLENMSAKEAYTYLKGQGAFDNMNIISGMAMEVSGVGMDMLTVDIPAGTSTNWSFTTISTDGINKKLYSWIVIKSAGQFMAMQDSSDDTTDIGTHFLNKINWVNSDVIGDKVKANPDYMQFYNDNATNVYFKYFILEYMTNTELAEDYAWIAIFSNNSQEVAACAYQAETGKNLTCDINGVVGIKELQKAYNNHFPNPATGIINFQTNLVGDATVQVFDNSGTLVQNLEIQISKNFQLNLSELSNGIYNVVVTSPNGNFAKKVIILK